MVRVRLSFTPEQLDLLDDVLQYYVMSDFGGGDHSAPADQAMLRDIQRRVHRSPRTFPGENGPEATT